MQEKRITVRLSDEAHEKFKIIAVKKRLSMTAILQRYIMELIEEAEKENGEEI